MNQRKEFVLKAIYTKNFRELCQEFGISTKTGYKWREKRRVRQRSEAGRICSGRKASAPNEIWTVDFKGWWHGANGQRCEPLTVRDEWTRYVLEVRAMPNAQTETVRACFERLFERNGLPEAIRSDNGVPFASSSSVLGLSKLSACGWL